MGVENVFLQYREGVFDQEILDAYGFTGGIWASPGFQKLWRTDRFRVLFDTTFVRAFEEVNGIR